MVIKTKQDITRYWMGHFTVPKEPTHYQDVMIINKHEYQKLKEIEGEIDNAIILSYFNNCKHT